MLRRMIGAATLNAATYKEIKADQGARWQAITVVLIVTLCGSIGSLLELQLSGPIPAGPVGVLDALLWLVLWGAFQLDTLTVLLIALVVGTVQWAMWTTVLYLVGGRMLRTGETKTSWAELWRMLGFAHTPHVLSIFTFIPAAFIPSAGWLSVGWLFGLAVFIWMLAAVIVAVRQALYPESTGRVALVMFIAAIIGFIPWLILLTLGIVVGVIVLGG